MSRNTITLRKIQTKDNSQIAEVIRNVLVELGVPKVGTAYEDSSLNRMAETYSSSNTLYLVIDDGSTILGGAGIAPLDNYNGNVCELQKMYILPKARGQGLGRQMLKTCLEFAKSAGFEKCYLETMPYMPHAQRLYKSFGFKAIEKPMGNTGHYSCNVWMLKQL